MPFALTSPAFEENAVIPARYTCDGENLSPALVWRDAPAGTRGFALLCHDPDSAFGDFTHWTLYDLPASLTALPEGGGELPGTSGLNGFGALGYAGPCPRRGEHRSMFELYALDTATLNLPSGADREAFEQALEDHLLARTRLIGRYERPPGRQTSASSCATQRRI